ncbi:MAG: class I SAM-dependent methyltransferase [Bacteroidota bacterium]
MIIQDMGKQLACPTGAIAPQVGDIMNKSNIDMINATLSKIPLSGVKRLLEIGHGNGKHISQLLDQYPNLNYEGVEISAEMYNESFENNQKFIDLDRAFFRLYEGDILPYANHSFDSILSINTIYYWKKPISYLNEIARVLSLSGQLHIAFIHKQTTQNQLFLGHDFHHFTHDEFVNLASQADFKVSNYTLKKEVATNKIGKRVNRFYGIYSLIKYKNNER